MAKAIPNAEEAARTKGGTFASPTSPSPSPSPSPDADASTGTGTVAARDIGAASSSQTTETAPRPPTGAAATNTAATAPPVSPHSKANALVIGMGGVGSVIGQKLHGYQGFHRIFLADIDPAFARKLQEKTPESRFEVAVLNAMETARVAAFLSEHQIAVTLNACTWHSNHSLLEACAQAGSHYIDLAADIYSPRGVRRPTKNSYEAEIERFDARFREKNLTAVLCMGCDPGAVNVFARWAMDHLDHAESIRVLDADNAEVRGYRFAVLFSPETLFEELGAVPYFVQAGRLTSGKPLETEVEWIRFPPPLGLMKAYAVAHEEGVSLGLHPPFVEKGVRHSVFKYTLSDKVVGIAKSLALLDVDTWRKVRVDGADVAPLRVVCANLPKPAALGATVDGHSCVGAEVRGIKDGRRVEYFVYTMDSHRAAFQRYGSSLTVVQTGIPPAVVADHLVCGLIPQHGVLMPESLDPQALMEGFVREGLPVHIEKREETLLGDWPGPAPPTTPAPQRESPRNPDR